MANFKFYTFSYPAGTYDAEGLDSSLWFTSLGSAVAQAREVARELAQNLDGPGDLQMGVTELHIDRVVLQDLSPRQLVLNVLNRQAYVESCEEGVAVVKIPWKNDSDV